MDRSAPIAAGFGVLALIAGVAVGLGAPSPLGLVAGGAGLLAAAIAMLSHRRQRQAEDRAHDADLENDRLRRQLRQVEEEKREAEVRLDWRSQMTATRRATEEDHLTDEVTGLLAEGWFVVALESRLAAARRNLRPVAVVVMDVVVGLSRRHPVPADPRRVTAAIKATIREADDAFRLRDGVFALLLDDTTDTGAMWTAERVREAVSGAEGDATIWAGVACYPAHGLTTEEVLDCADHALSAARGWPQTRIEVASSSDI